MVNLYLLLNQIKSPILSASLRLSLSDTLSEFIISFGGWDS